MAYNSEQLANLANQYWYAKTPQAYQNLITPYIGQQVQTKNALISGGEGQASNYTQFLNPITGAWEGDPNQNLRATSTAAAGGGIAPWEYESSPESTSLQVLGGFNLKNDDSYNISPYMTYNKGDDGNWTVGGGGYNSVYDTGDSLKTDDYVTMASVLAGGYAAGNALSAAGYGAGAAGTGAAGAGVAGAGGVTGLPSGGLADLFYGGGADLLPGASGVAGSTLGGGASIAGGSALGGLGSTAAGAGAAASGGSSSFLQQLATKLGGGAVSSVLGGGGGSSGSTAGGGTNLNGLAGLLTGLYGMNQQQGASNDMLNYLKQRQQMNDNMYADGSPEKNALQQEMERKDAAAGRNSQYGPRSVDLAARIAQLKMDANTKLTTGIGKYMADSYNQRALAGSNVTNSLPALLNGSGLGGMSLTDLTKWLGNNFDMTNYSDPSTWDWSGALSGSNYGSGAATDLWGELGI
jgi:hypothetical protein